MRVLGLTRQLHSAATAMTRRVLFLTYAKPTALATRTTRPSRWPSITALTLSLYPPPRAPVRFLSCSPRRDLQQLPQPPSEYDYDPSLDQRFLPRLARELTLSLQWATYHAKLRRLATKAPRPRAALTRRRLAIVAACFAAAAVLYWQKSEVMPVTGRRRLNLISDARLNGMYDNLTPLERLHRHLGQHGGHLVPDSDPRTQRVNRVLANLLPVSGVGDYPWKIHVIDSPDSGQAMFVERGSVPQIYAYIRMLDFLTTDDRLAGVLAHELAHASTQHSNELATWFAGAAMLLGALPLMFRKVSPLSLPRTLLMTWAIGGPLLHVLSLLPMQRGIETEADILGLLTMAEAGYDPRDMPLLFETLQVLDPPQYDFMRSHPPIRQRIQVIEEWVPRAMEKRAQTIHRETEGRLEASGQTLST